MSPNERSPALTGLLWGVGLLLWVGILSGTIPNPIFHRIIPATALDRVYLALSALLGGAFMAQRSRLASTAGACEATAGAGGFVAFLGFSCPLCNQVLIWVVGTQGALAWVEPYVAWIGAAGVLILVAANAWMWRLRTPRAA